MSEPTPVLMTRYRCPFCGATRSTKGVARSHMTRCKAREATNDE